MTSGRIIVLLIIGVTLVFGAAMWWANTRAYYVVLDHVDIAVQHGDGALIPLEISDAQGIDADTSPLRFRACFILDAGDTLAEAIPYADPTPLIAPGWFDCFDATAIGTALEAGEATAVLSQPEIARGVDRVVVTFPDGRGFAWNQLNGTLE